MKLPTESLGPTPDLTDAGTSTAQAVARLERSRARLRHALTPAQPAPGTSEGWSFKLLEHARTWLRGTPWGTLVEPLVSAAGDTLSAWWARQPWRDAALQARDTLAADLSPWVRRHPIAAIAVAAVAGATVAASGVWRWRSLRRSGLHLAANLRRAVTGQFRSPAVQSLILGAVLSYLAGRKQSAGTQPQQAADGADAACSQANSAERQTPVADRMPSVATRR